MRLLILFILLLLSFFSFSFNHSSALFLNSLRFEQLTLFIMWMTNAGMVFGTAMLAITLFTTKKIQLLALAIAAGLLALEMGFVLKELFAIPRPYLVWQDFTPLTVADGPYSFPSMHTAFMFSLLPIVERSTKNWLPRSVWLIFATLIALSRIYLGVHTVSDIFFGAFVGYSIGYLLTFADERFKLMDFFFHHIRNTFEFRRQIAHAMIGIAIIVLAQLRLITPLILGVILIVGGITSYIARSQSVPVITELLVYFERDLKRRTFPGQGAFFLVLGSFLSLVLFPLDIASAAIAIMAIGDATTTIVGNFFGKRKNPFNQEKHLEATACGIIVATVASSFFVPLLPAFLGSVAGMIVESLSCKILGYCIDDNLLVPVVSGGVIWLLSFMI